MNATQIVMIIVISILAIIMIALQIIKNGYRKFIIDTIVLAEKTLENNETKFNMVVEKTIAKLPIPLNFIPTSFVEDLVQKIFDEIKIALDYKEE